jgi:hypothetical protein
MSDSVEARFGAPAGGAPEPALKARSEAFAQSEIAAGARYAALRSNREVRSGRNIFAWR